MRTSSPRDQAWKGQPGFASDDGGGRGGDFGGVEGEGGLAFGEVPREA